MDFFFPSYSNEHTSRVTTKLIKLKFGSIIGNTVSENEVVLDSAD